MSMTIDSLIVDLMEPDFTKFMEVIWEIDEPFIKDLDEVLFDDPEYLKSKEELIEEIKIDLQPLQELKRPDSPSASKALSIKPHEKKKTKSEGINIESMPIEDLLERIRCKCRGFHEKFKERAISLQRTSFLSETSNVKRKHSGMAGLIEYKTTPSFVESQQKCIEYQSVKDIAINFIDNLLIDAKEKVAAQREPSDHESESEKYAEGIMDLVKDTDDEDITSVTSYSSEMGLLLIKDFTPKSGKVLILNSILTWNLKKEWSYCIKFIQENSDACSDFYVYEVIWSLPTISYPIPQVTASVFFTIEVSRVKPKMCPVKVTYNFETERCKFKLEDDIQHEKFLNNILKCKITFFKSIRM